MHRKLWQVRSILRNLKKGKFKAMFRYFYDSRYRKDIDYMLGLVRKFEVTCVDGELPLGEIIHGHTINYPEWVKTLRVQIRLKGYQSLKPIKVIWDPRSHKYMIVDGNHRFAALKQELTVFQKIKVKLLLVDYDKL